MPISVKRLQHIMAEAEAAAASAAPAISAFERLLAQGNPINQRMQELTAEGGGSLAAAIRDTTTACNFLQAANVTAPLIEEFASAQLKSLDWEGIGFPDPGITGMVNSAMVRALIEQSEQTTAIVTRAAGALFEQSEQTTAIVTRAAGALFEHERIAGLLSPQLSLMPELPGLAGAALYLAGTAPLRDLWDDLKPEQCLVAPYVPRPRSSDERQDMRRGVRAAFSIGGYAQLGDVRIGVVAAGDYIQSEHRHYHLTEEMRVRVEVQLVTGEQRVILAAGPMPLAYIPKAGMRLDLSVIYELKVLAPNHLIPRELRVRDLAVGIRDGGHCYILEVQGL